MTLASSRTNFLRKHGDPSLIHNIRYSHGVPLHMIVEVYDLDKAQETLPGKFDYKVVFEEVSKPSKDYIPKWHVEFEKAAKSIASARPLISELEDSDVDDDKQEDSDLFQELSSIAKTL